MKRQVGFVALLVTLILFAHFVWPTPYRYFVLPNTGSGTPSYLVRVNRINQRFCVIEHGAWYCPEERAEIAERESVEIGRRCKNAVGAGAFSDPRNRRIIELNGYAFPCQ